MARLMDRRLITGESVVESKPAVAAAGDAGPHLKVECLPGKMPSVKTKSDYAAPLEAAGYRLVDTVDAALDFLVLADPYSNRSKAQKARKLQVTLVSEEHLQRML